MALRSLSTRASRQCLLRSSVASHSRSIFRTNPLATWIPPKPTWVDIGRGWVPERLQFGAHVASISADIHPAKSSEIEEPLDPFSLVADELSITAKRLRLMVNTEVPSLASAAQYFFKMGAEGKRFRPTVLLLMASALNISKPISAINDVPSRLSKELRARQQRIAEIAEMIHVASLLHDDVLDDAEKRRGVGSLNFVVGNKLAVLSGNFLLSRACIALASLNNTEVLTLIVTIIENLITGEMMQMTTTPDKRYSMEYYIQKTYYKTASLFSNSCKSIAVLADQTEEVAMLAHGYGRNLVSCHLWYKL